MGGGEFFDFLKAKNEEIFKKNIFWDLVQNKNSLWRKKILNTFFNFFLIFVVCSLVYKEGFYKLKKY